jgi:hypothetical protein
LERELEGPGAQLLLEDVQVGGPEQAAGAGQDYTHVVIRIVELPPLHRPAVARVRVGPGKVVHGARQDLPGREAHHRDHAGEEQDAGPGSVRDLPIGDGGRVHRIRTGSR